MLLTWARFGVAYVSGWLLYVERLRARLGGACAAARVGMRQCAGYHATGDHTRTRQAFFVVPSTAVLLMFAYVTNVEVLPVVAR